MKAFILPLSLAITAPAVAQTVAAPSEPAHQVVEIYHIAPGQHAAFLRFIDKCDEANRMAGLPSRQLYVHTDGADWDYMLIQPAETPKDKAAALDAAWKKLGMPSGANFAFEIRKYIADHSDTFVSGPTTAKAYLAGATAP